VALIYNWWSLFVWLADPDQHRQVITSVAQARPALAARAAPTATTARWRRAWDCVDRRMHLKPQHLGSRTRPACGSTGAFQCLLRVGTGQCVGFVSSYEWLVRRPLAYEFGQIVR